MPPTTEINLLLTCATEAVALAEAGELAGGYTLLVTGLHRARQMGIEGEEWAEELARRWQQTCDSYIDFYGVIVN